ncbi:MAG: AzlC family ABC transporter permease [Beijerinckiaceae bacterium]
MTVPPDKNPGASGKGATQNPALPVSGTVADAFLDGLRVAGRGPFLYLGLTFLGVGSLAYEADVPLGVTLLATILIWAGPAQVIFLGAIINGLTLPAIALSISLSSVRLLPMCVSLLPLLRSKDQSLLTRIYCAHNVAVTAWVESIHRLPGMEQSRRTPWFLGLAHGLIASALAATFIGYTASGVLPAQIGAGMLFVTPVYFTLALVRNAREAIDWMSLGVGFLLAPAMRYLFGSGFDLLALGLIGGTIAYAGQRMWKTRAQRRPQP